MARSGPPAASGVPALFRRFSPYLRPVRGPVAGVAALLLAAPLIAAALIWLIKILVDEVLIGGGLGLLPLLGGAYVLAAAGRAGLGYATARLDASVGERIARDIRVNLYRHAISVSPGSLPDRGPGDRLAHLSGDVERTQALIYKAPLSLFADLAAAALFMALLLLLDWLLTLAALLAVPLLALASARNAPRLRRAARVARRLTSRWFALAEERLGATPLVHAYGTQEIETARFAASCEAARRAELRTVSVEAWLALLIESATALGGLLVLGVGAWRITEGSLTVGALVAFLGAVGSLYSPVKGLARAAGRFQRAAAGAQRVSDLLDRPSLVRERPAARPLAPVRGAVEFRNVSFRYPDGETVLRDISLRIEPGQVVAIAGASGSGKSTLVKLLLRLYDPSAGAILVDGTDLRDLTLDSLRRAVSAVFQEPYIVQGTVGENLRYGSAGASEASVLAAAEAAHVHPFIGALGAGYRAPVGPRGGRLSGGQRQRLALARAMLRNAPILVLDEATASVDSETEELILRAIEDLAGQRTLILVGHRLSTLRRADSVLVLDHGRLVESGPPAALLRAGSRYHDLFAPQLALARAAG